MGQGLGSMPWTGRRHLHSLGYKVEGLKGYKQGIWSAALQRMSWVRAPLGSTSEAAAVSGWRRHLLAVSSSGIAAWSPGSQGSCGRLRILTLECERERRTGYLGHTWLTNLAAWSFYANLKVCYQAAGGLAAEAGRPVLMDSPGDGPIRPSHESPPASSPCVGGKNHFSYFVLSPGLALQPDRPICLRLTDGGGAQERRMSDGRGQPRVSSKDQTQKPGQEPPFSGCSRESDQH